MAETKLYQRKISLWLFFYQNSFKENLLSIVSIVFVPFWAISNQETELDALKSRQKLLLEELKKKTDYYATKTLIERFDVATPKAQDKKTKQMDEIKMSSKPLHQQIVSNQLRKRENDDGKKSDNLFAPSPVPVVPSPKTTQPPNPTWMDRLMDSIVGSDESDSQKFALICEKCFAHNGLANPHEFNVISNKHFNQPRRSRSLELSQDEEVKDLKETAAKTIVVLFSLTIQLVKVGPTN
ncbi:hypothetical protein O9G_002912 [Rozella allomycis CSF55]|uniref:Endoplasmic reticulum junction formation protein lunapark n=1 Tax=Rozella allomycis (strain CSF55) TaxID=988480 RepID=A0A075B210_ROZAC|nr:hypothetical protein O9G_002912 [Rozella allomycis CSF55]|eukprot:EPZ36410.1 hypothetical protein O9G_002912 [Rozella allomycis CSF55]